MQHWAVFRAERYCEVIVDDLLMLIPDNKSHKAKLEDLLKALLKNGLKILPKNVSCLTRNLQYISNNIFIKKKKLCVKPLRMIIEAI